MCLRHSRQFRNRCDPFQGFVPDIAFLGRQLQRDIYAIGILMRGTHRDDHRATLTSILGRPTFQPIQIEMMTERKEKERIY